MFNFLTFSRDTITKLLTLENVCRFSVYYRGRLSAYTTLHTWVVYNVNILFLFREGTLQYTKPRNPFVLYL